MLMDVHTKLLAQGLWTSSDKRLKKNVKNVESALELVNKLQPKKYEYKTDGKYGTANFTKGKVYGFLAQDLEKIIPEMVTTAPIKFNSKDKDDHNDYSEDYKAVSYQMLIPILTQAIKEQQQEIVVLREELMNLKQLVSNTTHVDQCQIAAILYLKISLTHLGYQLKYHIT